MGLKEDLVAGETVDAETFTFSVEDIPCQNTSCKFQVSERVKLQDALEEGQAWQSEGLEEVGTFRDVQHCAVLATDLCPCWKPSHVFQVENEDFNEGQEMEEMVDAENGDFDEDLEEMEEMVEAENGDFDEGLEEMEEMVGAEELQNQEFLEFLEGEEEELLEEPCCEDLCASQSSFFLFY